ncbi:MAG TPA: tetratricopeptide repeat protein [Polyangiaceae bacterium]|jgi:tetratricopeptide (TPR) repeat protein|nr:tetratricopeptide repeat protein [Polyangiaceae bacterium]
MVTPINLPRARTVVRLHDRLGRLHHRGHSWVKQAYLPCLDRLEKAVSHADKRLAAHGWRELGRVHDLNGTPRAAMRAYQRWLALEPESVEAWRAIAALHESMGEYDRANLALKRADRIAPAHGGVLGDVERVLWLWSEKYPPIYDARSIAWRIGEEIAAGRGTRALQLLTRKRAAAFRQLRARVYGARNDADQVLAEWQAIADTARRIQIQHADWYYAFQGAAADDARLWRLLLWKVRPKLETGGFFCSQSLMELDVSEIKRFELLVRFRLARVERDVAALLALAGNYPSWRDPGEAALRMVQGR